MQFSKCRNWLVGTAIFLFAGGFFPAFAQWNPNQHVIDNVIESRIDRRKTERKIRGAQKRGNSKASAGTRPTVKAAKPLARQNLEIHRDTWQDWNLGEGYKVNFMFTSLTAPARVLVKPANYDSINGAAYFSDLPLGSYRVTAECIYNNKKYKVHIATESGTFENPTGGNFSPSKNITVKQKIDYYGSKVIGTDPEILYLRIIE